MTNTIVKTLALSSLFAAAALLANAAEATFDKEKVCGAQMKQNQTDIAAMEAILPDEAAVKVLLQAAIARVPGNNICIGDLLGANNQTLANILGQLASSPANGNEIETAAGPEAGDTDGAGSQVFGNTETPAGENPGQLNTPVQAPAASPSAPVAVPAL